MSELVTLQHRKQWATQARITSRFEDPSRILCRQRNISADVATVTTSPIVPHNTPFEHELSVILLNLLGSWESISRQRAHNIHLITCVPQGIYEQSQTTRLCTFNSVYFV